jgi:hypothetical protein
MDARNLLLGDRSAKRGRRAECLAHEQRMPSLRDRPFSKWPIGFTLARFWSSAASSSAHNGAVGMVARLPLNSGNDAGVAMASRKALV